MYVSKHGAVALLSAAALAGSATTAVSATGHEPGDHGDHHGGTLLDTSLAPSVPSDPAIHGASPGGAPWVLDHGHARLRPDRELRVRIRGLVIPTAFGNGTPGPVMTVSASLYCGADTTPAGTTPSVLISRRGDAEIDGQVGVPAKCLALTVLVHPNGAGAVYIAANGSVRNAPGRRPALLGPLCFDPAADEVNGVYRDPAIRMAQGIVRVAHDPLQDSIGQHRSFDFNAISSPTHSFAT